MGDMWLEQGITIGTREEQKVLVTSAEQVEEAREGLGCRPTAEWREEP